MVFKVKSNNHQELKVVTMKISSGDCKLMVIIGTEIVPFYYEAFCAVC